MIIALTLSLVKTGKKNAVVALGFSVLEESGSKSQGTGRQSKTWLHNWVEKSNDLRRPSRESCGFHEKPRPS